MNKSDGQLDGLTILRFAHAFEGGGGVENHLSDLNHELSCRNNITTVQMQLTRSGAGLAEHEEAIGGSRVIHVPLLTAAPWRVSASGTHQTTWKRSSRDRLINLLLRTDWQNSLASRLFIQRRRIPRRELEAAGAGQKARELLRRFHVDLVVLHTSGGNDASEILDVARRARIPAILVHHFSNDRLAGITVRQQASMVAAVGGASSVGVPPYLKRRYFNLSDAVDLGFYDRARAQPVARSFQTPVLYAPGRLTPDKGQMDAVRIAARLHTRGLPVTLVFAGRLDSEEFGQALRQEAARTGISDSVVFLGELTLSQYRDWFGAARLLLMPTHHHEGMPRTLIDAQAMKVPPLVYDIGGTREGLLDGKTGHLIPLGDIEAMAAAAEQLLTNPARHEAMADAARAFVEGQFSLAAFAGRHEQLYRRVVRSRLPARPLTGTPHAASTETGR